MAINFPAAEMSSAVEAQSYTALGCWISPGLPLDRNKVIPQPDQCASWQEDWRHAVEQSSPDVAVIMVGAWEIMDHQVDGHAVRFGSPEWDAVVRQGVEQAITAVSGAKVVSLMNVPCMNQPAKAAVPAQARNDPARQATLNAIIEQVAAERGAKVLDLRGLLCPGGEYAEQLDGIDMRYDGVHLTAEGAAVVWRWLVGQVSQLQQAAG